MRKVLVVDDEAAISDGIAALLGLEEIDAVAAYDRESAEAILMNGHFHVVLADLRLHTEEEGLLLLDSIRRLSPGTRIATLTGFATPAVEDELLRRGSSVVLRKPMSFEDVIAVVTEMLEAIEQEAAAQLEMRGELDLDRLYTDVKRVLYSIPQKRFGLTSEETDDLVQDAWLLFLEKRRSIANGRAWLAGTVVNLCKQRIYKNSRQRALTCELMEADLDMLATADGVSLDTMALQQALGSLDPRGRSLCTLIGIEGHSYEEAGELLGLPIGSVGPLYIRAKAKLEKILRTTH